MFGQVVRKTMLSENNMLRGFSNLNKLYFSFRSFDDTRN